MPIKGVILCLILTAAFTQTVTISNCLQLDLLNSVCTICRPGFQLSAGQCNHCLPNFSLLNGNCVSTTAPLTTLPGLTVTGATQTQQSSTQQTSGSASPQISSSTVTTTSTSSSASITAPTVIASQNTASNPVFLPFILQGLVTMPGPIGIIRPVYPDPNCKRYNIFKICWECYTGFYVNPFNLVCTATNPLCQNVSSTNRCLSCYAGYALTNGNCTIIPQYNREVDVNCKTEVNSICLECFQSYYLNRSINFCQQANHKCKTITESNTCQSCYQGYLLINQDCVISSAYFQSFSDFNCAVFTNGSCTECVTRFYMGPSGQCLMVDPFCQNYTSSGDCLLCYVGYQLYSGACGLVSYNSTGYSNGLIQCPYRSIPRPDYCQQVSDQCKTWSDITALCLSCYQGYEVNDAGQCVIQ